MMGCEYCENEEDIWCGEYTGGHIGYNDFLYVTEFEDCNIDKIKINFCPMCGRRLGDTND